MRRGATIIFKIAALSLILAGCAGESGENVAVVTDCVEVPDGTYYIMEKGRLVAINAPEPTIIERVVEQPTSWSQDLQATFPEMGFPWMGLQVNGPVATLTGLAPDIDSKKRALEAGEQAVYDDEAGARQVTVVVDGIAVEGGEQAVGAGLAELSNNTLSLEACEQAFVETMQGRNVQFRLGSDVIRKQSATLLDAVTGVAIFCKDYSIEIAGHTDFKGPDDANMILSQNRANAVKAYLVKRGVPEDSLNAVGYGESQPIDPALTDEAAAINRRTEFKVSLKRQD